MPLRPFLTNSDGSLPTLQSYPQAGAEVLAWNAIDRATRALRAQLVVNGAPVGASNPLPISVGGAIPIWVAAPATATSTGTAGQMAYDNFYLYVCINTDTWRRVPIGDW